MRSPALLKIFFGADPGPLAETALAYHRELLAFFEATRARGNVPEAPARALETGINYHRFWGAQWERLGGKS